MKKRPGREAGIFAMMLLSGSLASCTVLLDGDTVQCNVSADCAAKGGDFATSVCVAGACEAPPPETVVGALAGTPFACVPPATATVTKRTFTGKVYLFDVLKTRAGQATKVVNGVSFAPAPGVPVRICLVTDVECAKPRSTLTTDPLGAVNITFATATPTYLEVRDPAYFPMRFFPPDYFRDTDNALIVGLITEAGLRANAASAGVDIEGGIGPAATVGHVGVRASDCRRATAAGTSWEIGEASAATRAYALGDAFSTTATATDAGGFVHFFNAKPGAAELRGTYAGQEIAKPSARVQPGVLSIVYSWPP